MKLIVSAILILVLNFIVLHLIGLVNHAISPIAVMIYLPALFFFPCFIHLNIKGCVMVFTVTGFALDHVYNTATGFHLLCLVCCIVSLRFVASKGKFGKFSRPHFMQLIANTFISLVLFITLYFFPIKGGTWTPINFTVDLILSSLAFLILCPWFNKLCSQSLNTMISTMKNMSE